MIIMVSTGMVLAMAQIMVYVMHNRKLAKHGVTNNDDGTEVILYRP